MKALTVTVSQLNRYIKAVLEEDRKLSGIFVKGEISGFTRHYKSGHCYFHLKDETASIRAVLFKSHAQDLVFDPEDGMAVLAQGNVGVFERDGAYQLYVTDLQPEGVGALAVAFEQVKKRLAALGMFEERYKKPLPAYPRRIGVITSETGAALQDIQNVIGRRYPLATLVLCPAVVQGREAPAQLVRAVETLDRKGRCDVIIIGRGGGSAEDLSCFNDEKLAHAVFRAETPVVSAVGHETDFTICDFVADLRAPTPSAAAELVTPSVANLRERVAAVAEYLRLSAGNLLELWGRRLEGAAQSPALKNPGMIPRKKQERLDFLWKSMYNKKSVFIQAVGDALGRRAALLDSLSPLRVMDRGYCVTYRGETPLSSAGEVAPGQELRVRFRDGAVRSEVVTVELDDRRG